MSRLSEVKEHMEVIGADGVHIGTVDGVKGERIKLTKSDSGMGAHQDHHHYIPGGLIAEVEGNRVRLSATAANARQFIEEKSGPDNGKRLWSWNRIGIGAAVIGAVGAATVAAMKTRQGQSDDQSDDDFELRLQTDETMRLISSSKVEGTPVVGRDGEKLGSIKNFMVDKYTGRVAYAVMEFGGHFGFGKSLFPLPWPMLDYDVEKDGYVLNITKDDLADAPRFEASNEPEFDPVYRRRLLVFHGGRMPA